MFNISATNRGTARNEADNYQTPISVINNFLDHHQLKDGNILEPSASSGNFVSVIREREINKHYITSVELREEEYNNLLIHSDEVFIANFLTWKTNRKYKTIIGNPPYNLAIEFMEKCFEIADKDTEIIMLLRTAFLKSKKRYDFWQKHPVNGLYVLSQRPSFTGHGTDATSYSFFVWNSSNKQEIKVI